MPIKHEELHKMKDAEIVEEVQRMRKRIFELKTQALTEKLENPREFGNLRRDIARMLTEQNNRKIAAKQAQTQEAV